VLFADVVRSMDIAAAVDAERLREIMTELVERSAAVVHRYDGGSIEYTGDGVMALFGAPVALEDHAFRACLAALAIQEETNLGGGCLALRRRERGVHRRLGDGDLRRPGGVGGSCFSGVPCRAGHPAPVDKWRRTSDWAERLSSRSSRLPELKCGRRDGSTNAFVYAGLRKWSDVEQAP
jgi:hypothetical protein